MVNSRDAPLGLVFGALADPTRREIIAQLASGERSVGELAARFTMTLPAVLKHVGVLERAGLAATHRAGRERRCRLVAAPMRDAARWLDRYRAYWEQQFDQLDAYLRSHPTDTEEPTWSPPPPPPPPATRSPSASRARSPRPASGSSAR